MTLLISLTVAVLFGSGAYMMLQRNLVRVVVGIVLISNAANLYIISAGLSTGPPPILPASGGVSDPLVQAMVLTALVISSSVASLLLALVYRLYRSHGSIDIEDISRAEVDAASALEEESLARALSREEETTSSASNNADPEREAAERGDYSGRGSGGDS